MDALSVVYDQGASLEQLRGAEQALTELADAIERRLEGAAQRQETGALDRLAGKGEGGRDEVAHDRQRLDDVRTVINTVQQRIGRAQVKLDEQDRQARLKKATALLKERQDKYLAIGRLIEEAGALFSDVVRLGREAEAISPFIKTRRDLVGVWGYRPSELAVHLLARMNSEFGHPASTMSVDGSYLDKLIFSQRDGGLAKVLRSTDDVILGVDPDFPEAA